MRFVTLISLKPSKALVLLVLSLFLPLSVKAETIRGKVVSIADGDTVTVLDFLRRERKIRLNGIDAPELEQAFGQAAKHHLSRLIFGKYVRVEWRKIDDYGRVVGTIFFSGGDANLKQLQSGYAWYFLKYEGDVIPARRKPYANAEREARSARRGLWADRNPIAPWDFRHPESAKSEPTRPGNQTAAPQPTTPQPQPSSGKIIGNRNSRIYHLPNCPDYDRVSERNRAYFDKEVEAVKAGFRKARNCP